MSSPRISASIHPIGNTGSSAKAPTRPRMKMGQRKDRRRGILGLEKAMIPGRKQGTNRNNEARLRTATSGWAQAASRETVHSARSDQKTRLRCTQENRKGRNRYIWTSKGNDHKTFTMDLTCTRFCRSKICET